MVKFIVSVISQNRKKGTETHYVIHLGPGQGSKILFLHLDAGVYFAILLNHTTRFSNSINVVIPASCCCLECLSLFHVFLHPDGYVLYPCKARWLQLYRTFHCLSPRRGSILQEQSSAEMDIFLYHLLQPHYAHSHADLA